VNDLSVSVVIPTYNCAARLPDAVGSVRAQEWPELEIIVVDDGSTDDTAVVLKKLAGSDIRCIRQANAGPAAARNTGIAAARGQWIAFLDADDLWLPDKLAVQLGEICRYPEAGFSYAGARVQYVSGREFDITCSPLSGPLFLDLLLGSSLATPTVVVRRECFKKVGLFDAALRTGEDWDMWLRLSARFRHVYVSRPLALIRKDVNIRNVSLETLESCTRRVLQRLFSCSQTRQRYPTLAAQRRRIYAWHYWVLAKSYLRHHRVGAFCRLGAKTLWSRQLGLGCLMGKGVGPP
jgi:glycosyltransferase involved in cell wall biosynthesis